MYQRNSDAKLSNTANASSSGQRILQMTPTNTQNQNFMQTHSPKLYYALN